MIPIADNLREIQERIWAAAARSGRERDEIRLVAVTKTRGVDLIRQAIDAGVKELGENYVSEAETKFAGLERGVAVRHMIGHLQRNKAARAAACFDMIQTLDSEALALALDRQMESRGERLPVLIQVNATGEETKSGVRPEGLRRLADSVRSRGHLDLQGLMGIGSLQGGEEETVAAFRRLYRLWDQLPDENRKVLSMGMSGDFELAIGEGSTMVRVGAALFGARRTMG